MPMKRTVLSSMLLCVILLSVVLLSGCGQRNVDMTVSGIAYKADDAAFQEVCEVTFHGIYTESLLASGLYQGQISVHHASVIDPEDGVMELRFTDDIAVPTAKKASGYQYTSQIHSVLRDESAQSLVLVLYNAYEKTGDTLIGSFDKTNPVFICVGEISREDAIHLISERYDH